MAAGRAKSTLLAPIVRKWCLKDWTWPERALSARALSEQIFERPQDWRIQPDQNRIRHAKFRRDQLEGLLMGWELDLDE